MGPTAFSDSDIEEENHLLQMTDFMKRSEAPSWIDKAEWTTNIRENSDFDRLRSPSDVSVFRVPKFLIESTKREVFVPKMVALGPYHRSAELHPMNSYKQRAVCSMMMRFSTVRNDANIPDFSSQAMQGISHLEDEIRKMYEENIDFPSEMLKGLLIEDGCFILEILRTLGGKRFPVAEASNYYESIFERHRIDFTGLDILNDMLKLENQIPLKVLRGLLLLLNSTNVDERLYKVLLKYPFPKFYPFQVYDMTKLPWQQRDENIHHLLSWLHSLIVSSGPGSSSRSSSELHADDISGNYMRFIPRAVELKNVGIKFKPCEGYIKLIHFDQEKATIFLPCINITSHTEVLFRNLIALEVCKPSAVNYVTCYVSLMDGLIDTGEDVAVLRDKGIVTNYRGSDKETAQLFNGLLKGVTLSRKDAFKQLKQDVDEYYKSHFKVWFAEFMKVHFSSPWKGLALLAAILMLIFTAVQTVFSILSVVLK